MLRQAVQRGTRYRGPWYCQTNKGETVKDRTRFEEIIGMSYRTLLILIIVLIIVLSMLFG